MPESNESRITRAEVKAALETLLEICQRNNAGFCGFVFGVDPPLVVRFSNVKETGQAFTQLLIQLNDLAEDRAEKGQVIQDPFTGVN